MVHAAGFTRDKLLLQMSDRDFDDVLAVHLTGGFLASRHALPTMLARRWGRIVYLVSPTALVGRRGQINYAAAKAGLIGLARSLAREVGPLSVTVNCVSAGFVDTGLTAGIPADVRAELVAAIPLGRPGRPEEVAAAVVSWSETTSVRPSRASHAQRGSVTCASVSAGCNHDRHGERADQDASLERHMTRSVACWITGTSGGGPGVRRRFRRPADSDDGARQPAESRRSGHMAGVPRLGAGDCCCRAIGVVAPCCSSRCSSVGADGGEPRSG
jgi:hypothetical protein